MKRLLKNGILALLVFFIFTYPMYHITSVQAAGKINKTSVTLMAGKTTNLELKGTSQKISWTSSNKRIASVNSSGKVTAISAGKATISAKASGKKYSSIVTVLPKFTEADNSDKMKNILDGRYLDVTVNENIQSFQIVTNEITEFNIQNVKVSTSTQLATVKAKMIIDRSIATVSSEALFTYSIKANKWKLQEISFTNSINSISLLGLWRGKYEIYSGDVGLDLDIQTLTEDGYATGVFKFYAAPTNPKFESGSYTVKGGVDYETGKVAFTGVNWIVEPEDYSMIDFNGNIDLVNKSLIGGRYNFKLSKVVE